MKDEFAVNKFNEYEDEYKQSKLDEVDNKNVIMRSTMNTKACGEVDEEVVNEDNNNEIYCEENVAYCKEIGDDMC